MNCDGGYKNWETNDNNKVQSYERRRVTGVGNIPTVGRRSKASGFGSTPTAGSLPGTSKTNPLFQASPRPQRQDSLFNHCRNTQPPFV